MYLIDATPLQSEHRQRGVGTYVRYLVDALLRIAPDEVQFAISSSPGVTLPDAIMARSKANPRGHRPAQVYWLYNEIFLRYALLESRPQVFHSTDFNGLVSLPGIPTVATLHDTMALKQTTTARQTLSEHLSQLRWSVYFRKLKHATAIITVSDAVREDAVQYLGIDPNRMTTINPGVDVHQFRPDLSLPPELDIGQYFLCVGACQPNKNYERILQAFSRVAQQYANVRLVIAGRWRPDQMEWLRATIDFLGITRRVLHLGYVSADLLPALYSNAVAFLFPSIDEGFGSPVVEAMASGTPVVTTNSGALKEVAGSAGFLVNPYDTTHIEKALTDIYAQPRLRQELIQLGLRRSRQFSWERAAEQTLDVYHCASDPQVIA